jgi:hypothetical protein
MVGATMVILDLPYHGKKKFGIYHGIVIARNVL